MKVPLLDLKAQLKPIRGDILAAITEVIDSTRYIGGPKVERLESVIAEYSNVACGVGVSSGSDALLISLMAMDITAGTRVITTPFSFFATAGAIVRLGARPVFIDIEPVSYNMSPDLLRELLEREKHSDDIKAVMPVHLYGQMADMDPIVELCEDRGIFVIEDAAQAIGAQYPSRRGVKRAGSMGTAGCFSFFPSKNLGGAGDGGMVITNDHELAEKLKILRNHGAKPKYFHNLIGGNFRLDPIQAAVLLVKFLHLDKWSEARRENAAYYDSLFAESGLIEQGHVATPQIVWDDGTIENPHIFNQYVVRVREGKRDELRQWLASADVGVEVYYPVPFHEQRCFQNLGYRTGDFPESENAAREALALPIYPELTRKMQDYIIDRAVAFYQR